MADLKQHEIAIASVNLTQSWYNITAVKNNNAYAYTWNADTATNVSVVYPDGGYSLNNSNTFQQYLQFVMIQNNHYLIDQNGDYVYYITFTNNTTRGLLEIACYALPDTLPAGWSIPSGATWTLPTTPQTPQVTIGANMVTLLGIAAGTYPSAPQTTSYNVLGTIGPDFQHVKSIIIGCSLLLNTLAIPATTLFTVPVTTNDPTPGAIITSFSYNYAFEPINSGAYSDFIIRLYDQDGQRLIFSDPTLSIYLIIRKKGENLTK
jgi:hypothetical protein